MSFLSVCRYATSSTRTLLLGLPYFGLRLMLLSLVNLLIMIGTCPSTMSSSLHFLWLLLVFSIRMFPHAFASRYTMIIHLRVLMCVVKLEGDPGTEGTKIFSVCYRIIILIIGFTSSAEWPASKAYKFSSARDLSTELEFNLNLIQLLCPDPNLAALVALPKIPKTMPEEKIFNLDLIHGRNQIQ